MSESLIERRGGLQLPTMYKKYIVALVADRTQNGKRPLSDLPFAVNWIKGIARAGNDKLKSEMRIK